MKKLLLATAFAAAFTAAAQAAPTVPEFARRTWCQAETAWEGTTVYRTHGDCENNDDVMTIKASRYEGWEYACDFTAVKTWFDPSIPSATKTFGVHVFRITADCGGEGCTWKEQLTFWQSKGSLYVSNSRHWQNRCK